jgi:5-methylcytosine-specific restriction endonuclease McrA
MRRDEFPAKVKLAAFQRANGYCENALCQAKLWTGKFAYDHVIPCELGGDAGIRNCQVLCLVCHAEKTRNDQADIGKARRRERKHLGIKKRSRFACARSGPFKQKIDGSVVRRVPAG